MNTSKTITIPNAILVKIVACELYTSWYFDKIGKYYWVKKYNEREYYQYVTIEEAYDNFCGYLRDKDVEIIEVSDIKLTTETIVNINKIPSDSQLLNYLENMIAKNGIATITREILSETSGLRNYITKYGIYNEEVNQNT